MSVVSFPGYQPPPRYDSLPWTEARLEESATEVGAYTTVETFTLDPLDTDPTRPQGRSFTTSLGTGGPWYRFVWIDQLAAESAPTTPAENLNGRVPGPVTAYATAAELATILQVNATSNATALDRVLIGAAGEINSETGRSDLAGWELQLAAQVNLARAEELWKQMKAPYGVIGLDSEFGAVHISRDTFGRHALALAPLKREWGIA